MMKKKKHAQIIELMEKKQVISVKELAQALDCTEMTIRRNLDELQSLGFVQREHGFARLLHTAEPTEYSIQSNEHVAEKKAIAAAALKLLSPGQTICLDSGTTTQQLALILPEDMTLSVITPSLEAALALSGHENIQVMIPGGQMHHKNRTILITDPAELQKYRADIAFISCRSFRVPGGAFEHTPTMVPTKKALSAIADKRVLLLDHSKWNVNSLCSCIPLEELDVIITDAGAPEKTVEAVTAAGKELIICNSPGA